MPAMSSITVFKNDGVTNIVFDMLAASPGDAGWAFWRQDTGAAAGLPVGLRPLISMMSKWNGPKTARQIKGQMIFPYAVQDSTTTLYSAKDRIMVDYFISVPQSIPSANINEGVAQSSNLIASLLWKQSGQAGYAPT